ncbi:hypothetical protein NEMBOFW57_002695 [Staphylotrichum longicolle]|uniref:Calcineurin-like phosphoesterase domain-containing protein n=1 Tax=Staphylotrichum longicolle TaxID=669026 RepID=A0AAD4F8H3_9PEZI|nr:hypothetical protein NEMBOFW57_002695 [Staphylotrichum longicolle]
MARPYNSKSSFSYPPRYYPDHSTSLFDDLRAFVAQLVRSLVRFWRERGRRMAFAALLSLAHRLRQNLTYNRLLSFPHLLVAVWVVVLLWGERWAFHSKVESCHWSSWEKWPAGAEPHRVALVADPQLIDPHSYPGRPWPLNPLTMLITDNYLRRSYNQLQWQLNPDSIFFLGDLFDGGREWKTAHGEFQDPEWGPHPKSEQKYLKKWHKTYGEWYWLQEYARFGDIFLNPWVKAGAGQGVGKNRRKLIASLPGNHDLGFGDQIKVSVRNRFENYFGEGNRVDVIGNHTFVKQSTELRFLRGEVQEGQFKHKIEELEKAKFDDKPNQGNNAPELPTILLTHVPLYRPPGTPCGPLRERSPPTKPPKGQTTPVFPDHRNAISVSGGYQYQNVLGEQDSETLVQKVGNVVHAFSGDDHDYCAVTHSPAQGNVPEITVKSISMAMGVSKPGFLLVSLYNPIDPATGKPLNPANQPTLQTHLCLLPNQLATYLRYVTFALLSVAVLAVRAFLVPVLGLTPFALDPLDSSSAHRSGGARRGGGGALLPTFKAKVEDYDEYALPPRGGGGGGGGGGFSASHFWNGGSTRDRSGVRRRPRRQMVQRRVVGIQIVGMARGMGGGRATGRGHRRVGGSGVGRRWCGGVGGEGRAED